MDSSITRGLYRDITDFAHTTPAWVQQFAEIFTDAGLLLFAVLFVVAWRRARHADARAFAVAVLAPLATAVGYVVSESLKSLVDEERPCRTVAEAAGSLATCPPYGDWSFPSNHSAIAGAAAAAIVLAWPLRLRIALLTAPLALLMAFSRVFVGVHYPHDVAVGLLLGAAVAAGCVMALAGPAAALTTTMRTSRAGIVVWFAGPGPASAHRAPSRAASRTASGAASARQQAHAPADMPGSEGHEHHERHERHRDSLHR
ncbi:phosphatase PAP2 family protein [Streptomyces sp. MUM 178J]|uniref:phosphatase PAP2 family protein n=1 Tax=Streptomyces sp. MUM 178J TaxID=2791991 RepID=UPI001F04FC3A|nr:phosphatase PAP2 family protein [Streptomyces sp. MUM 178J]WRQ82095.1 phosphatase PAP2 family protein [Streptomyces sp. MUM 178J]